MNLKKLSWHLILPMIMVSAEGMESTLIPKKAVTFSDTPSIQYIPSRSETLNMQTIQISINNENEEQSEAVIKKIKEALTGGCKKIIINDPHGFVK